MCVCVCVCMCMYEFVFSLDFKHFEHRACMLGDDNSQGGEYKVNVYELLLKWKGNECEVVVLWSEHLLEEKKQIVHVCPN